MVLKSDQERVKTLLSETITLLCRNGLHFQSELSVEALIGITLDREDVFLVSIKEVIQPTNSITTGPVISELQKKQQRYEDVQEVDLANASVASKVTPISSRSSNRDTNQKLGFFQEDGAEGRPNEIQKRKKRRWALETSSDQHSLENRSLSEGVCFDFPVQNRTEVITTDEELSEGTSVSTSKINVKENTQNEEKDVSVCRDETVSKVDLLGHDMSLDIVRIKEESFSADDDLQYYSTSAPFTEYPAQQFPATSFAINPFENTGPSFQMSDPSLSHMENESQSQGNNSSHSIDNFVTKPLRRGLCRSLDRRSGLPSTFNDQPQRCYRCQMCGTTIGDLNGYKEHVKRHRNIYKYYCNVCGKGFSASINLRGHLVKHTGVKEFCCQLCSKDFAYKRQLERHMVSAHPSAVQPPQVSSISFSDS